MFKLKIGRHFVELDVLLLRTLDRSALLGMMMMCVGFAACVRDSVLRLGVDRRPLALSGAIRYSLYFSTKRFLLGVSLLIPKFAASGIKTASIMYACGGLYR